MRAWVTTVVFSTLLHGVLATPPSAQELGLTKDQWYDWLSDHFGWYSFLPDYDANLAGVVLFGFILLVHLALGAYWRQWWFGICVSCGCVLEFLGFLGRFLSREISVFDQSYYIMQIVCLTLAPAFIMAGVYCILAKLVVVYGESYSRLGPIVYTIIFVVGDWVSIIIQAVGGGMAATKGNSNTGTWIMVAGIAFQVLVMSVFFLFYFEFLIRVYLGRRNAEILDSQAHKPDIEELRKKKKFPIFIAGQTVAIILIYTRSIYRIIELAGGWHGRLVINEVYMLVLDGLMMVLATYLLAIFHPGFMFGRVPMKANLHHKKLSNMKEEELNSSQNDEERVEW
ncbi:Sphingoid long-chain base transporter RSB1 [Yarrowia sp. C11]|nr:Sphingoid long-chain base transporter RSB1 [Yarrowia sp. E02]KAG5372776.1 Sphingoid long-chain base transporter RSB1 [Yarrowia sp. C11]